MSPGVQNRFGVRTESLSAGSRAARKAVTSAENRSWTSPGGQKRLAIERPMGLRNGLANRVADYRSYLFEQLHSSCFFVTRSPSWQ